jgi:protein-tyrosine phosphatase
MMRGVLFVCVGNLCRSPMAAGLLKHAMPTIAVSSAGLYATTGAHADVLAQQVMQAHGIDISTHRAQLLSTSLCANHDIVLVMDGALKDDVLNRYPHLRGRVHLLAQDAIADPYRRGYDAFLDCHSHIARAMDAWLPRLRALMSPSISDSL